MWLEVPPRVTTATIAVTWGATDTQAGVAYYDLDVRVEDGAWQRVLTHTESTNYEFTALSGSYFTFRVIATDNVSNAASAEATSSLARVTKYYYHGGRRVAMRAGGVVYYLHGDHLGSPALVTGQASNVIARQLFLPYGDTRYQEGTFPTDFGFTGQREDGGAGLLFMHARYYHAGLGRFVSADTVVPGAGNPQALNRYTYAVGNPLLYVDPTGHIFGLPPRPDVSIDISGWDPQVVQALDVVQETARIAAKVPVIAGPYAAAKAFLKYVSVDSAEGTMVIGNRAPRSATEVALEIAGLAAVISAPPNFSQILGEQGEETAIRHVLKQQDTEIPPYVESVTYDPTLDRLGRTTPLGGGRTAITIGPQAFSSESELASTLGHELVHARQYFEEAAGIRVYDWAGWEMEAYGWEVENAYRTGLSGEAFDQVLQVWGQFKDLWVKHHGR